MITSFFYIISRIGLIGLFVITFLISLHGFAVSEIKLGTTFILLILSSLGILIAIFIQKLSKVNMLTSIFLILPVSSLAILWGIESNLGNILNSYGFGDLLNNLFSDVLVVYYYFILPFLIIFGHWNIRWVDGVKSEKKVPEVLVAAFQTVLYALPAILVASTLFGIDLTAILTTSGILVAILGLALQPNLSNILSGVFVSLERPFRPNEWITIDDKTGVVLDVNWRSTKIRTFENTEVVIPNELVAKSTLQNWSRPDKEMMSEGFHIFNTMHFHPKHDPKYISTLLQNALSKVTPIDGRQALDLQWVKFIDVDEFGLKFAVAFDCTKRLLKSSQQNLVLTEIHQALSHAGISMSVGRLTSHLDQDVGLNALSDVFRQPTDFDPDIKDTLNPYNETVRNKALLRKVPIFTSLDEKELLSLAKDCSRKSIKASSTVCEEGSEGGSLFILVDGVVSVDKVGANSEGIHIAKLGVGDVFGEMSLMTGEPRSASVKALTNTVVLEIDKEIIRTLFGNNKDFYDNIAHVFAKRKLAMEDIEKSGVNPNEQMADLVTKFKKAMINFLGLK